MFYENTKILLVLRKLYDSYVLLSGKEKEYVLLAIKEIVGNLIKNSNSVLNIALYLYHNGFSTFEVEEMLKPQKLPYIWYITGEF